MKEIEEISVHPEHKDEMRKAAEFLIDRGWAQDPIVVTEDEPIWQEIQKDSHLWSFVRGFEGLNFYGKKSHIKVKRWFDDNDYYWFVLRLPVDPDELMADPDEVDYIVIDREVAKLFGFEPLDYLLKDF